MTLIEAKELLGSFDTSLREYAARKLIKRGVILRKGVVKQVTATTIQLQVGVQLGQGGGSATLTSGTVWWGVRG